MLRGSIQHSDLQVNLRAIVDGAAVTSGVPLGDELIALVEAALRHPERLPAARQRLKEQAGVAALVDAAGVIANFNRMTRIADGTGIPIDEAAVPRTADIRAQLDLDRFASTRLPD